MTAPALWQNRRVLVCVGPGGVGKTSVAAALSLAAVADGRQTLVMTIDPARRLANALGLEGADNSERHIDADTLRKAGLQPQGGLSVMMPDVKRTFDGMVERFATPEQRRRLFDNSIYQRFSTVLSGTLEFAAVEKLYEVYSAGAHDLIVLDTPPAQNAADFLDAPGKVIDFLEQESPEWLLKPYRVAAKLSMRLFDMSGSFVLSTLDRFAGADTLRELAEFVLGFQGMYDGLRERYRGVKNLLAADEVGFVLVTTPRREQREAALRFVVELEAAGIDVVAVVVNRVRPPLATGAEQAELLRAVQGALAGEAAADRATVLAAVKDELALAEEDRAAIAELSRAMGSRPTLVLPELDLDVHDLAGLAHLAGRLRVP